mmetsp:Transcript_2399/g.4694  ORF Transcript_2399/g.4694 Transcript_2399/m.4694 type:complete len:93 (-) Transcript_2399:373-651(-)
MFYVRPVTVWKLFTFPATAEDDLIRVLNVAHVDDLWAALVDAMIHLAILLFPQVGNAKQGDENPHQCALIPPKVHPDAVQAAADYHAAQQQD